MEVRFEPADFLTAGQGAEWCKVPGTHTRSRTRTQRSITNSRLETASVPAERIVWLGLDLEGGAGRSLPALLGRYMVHYTMPWPWHTSLGTRYIGKPWDDLDEIRSCSPPRPRLSSRLE